MKEIKLSQGKIALVDDEDFERLNKYNWCVSQKKKNYYAMRKDTAGKTVYMHHEVIGKPSRGLQTDHIDNNSLNNQRNNLRFVTPRDNAQNKKYIIKYSRYFGVSYNKRRIKDPWVARMRIKGVNTHLGYFSNEKEAAQAYQKAVRKIENPFASLSMNNLLTKIEELKQRGVRLNG